MINLELELDENEDVVIVDNVPTNLDCKFIRDLYKSEKVPSYWYDYLVTTKDVKKAKKKNRIRIKRAIKELEGIYTFEYIENEVKNQLDLDAQTKFYKRVHNDKNYIKSALKMGVKIGNYDT